MPERHASDLEVAHPLVSLLLRRLKPGGAGVRVLVLGAGSGRNLPPLLAAGISVDVVEPDAARRAAATARFRGALAHGSLQILDELGAAHDATLGDTRPATRCDALLSTHGLLHGTPVDVGAALHAALAHLAPSAAIYATFGSRRDPRFGSGTRIDDATWSPNGGREAGVPHAYFSRETLLRLLRDAGVKIDELTEDTAAETAGAWAHDAAEAATMRHWFAIARAPKAGTLQ